VMAAFDIKAIAQTVALRGVDSLVIGALVAAFALALLRTARRQSSAVRFAVWFSSLVAIAILPWLDGGLTLRLGSRGSSAAAIMGKPAITVPGSWAIYLFAAWAGIAAVALGRLCWGLWSLHVLRRSLVPVDIGMLDAGTREILARQEQKRSVVLCTSDRVSVPTAVGLVKPAVVIPAWLLGELTPAELNHILLHEFAHLRRCDDWTNLAQKIVKALFFFHPAVWWIEKKVSLEREMACDDVVLAESASPRAYAACLVRLAEKSLVRRSLALAQAAVGRICQTSQRVAKILDVNRPAGATTSWKPAVSLVAAFAVVCIAGIDRAPRLVAFENLRPQVLATSASHSLTQVAAKRSPAGAILGSRVVLAKASSEQIRPRVIEAKARLRGTAPRSGAYVASNLRRQRRSATDSAKLIHMARFQPPAAATETMFVVVEQNQYESSGQVMHGVSVWYILLVHAPADSGHGIPRKET